MVRLLPGTKSSRALAKGHLLSQRRLGTAAMLFKGGTSFLGTARYAEKVGKARGGRGNHAEVTQNWHRHAGRCGEGRKRGTHSRLCEWKGHIRSGSKSAEPVFSRWSTMARL